MNRIEKTVALLLIASMIVSITGCHKKIDKIDENADVYVSSDGRASVELISRPLT